MLAAATLSLTPLAMLLVGLAAFVAMVFDASNSARPPSQPPRPILSTTDMRAVLHGDTPEAPAPDLPPWAQVAHPATDRSAMVRGAEQAVRPPPDVGRDLCVIEAWARALQLGQHREPLDAGRQRTLALVVAALAAGDPATALRLAASMSGESADDLRATHAGAGVL